MSFAFFCFLKQEAKGLGHEHAGLGVCQLAQHLCCIDPRHRMPRVEFRNFRLMESLGKSRTAPKVRLKISETFKKNQNSFASFTK